MTREEYIEVCLRYSEYLNMTGSGACYIKGAITMGEYLVTDINYESPIIDSNKIIGKVWYKCYSPDKKTIQTQLKFCYYTHTKEAFETAIQEFIENYKKCLIKLKKQNIEKDFSK